MGIKMAVWERQVTVPATPIPFWVKKKVVVLIVEGIIAMLKVAVICLRIAWILPSGRGSVVITSGHCICCCVNTGIPRPPAPGGPMKPPASDKLTGTADELTSDILVGVEGAAPNITVT